MVQLSLLEQQSITLTDLLDDLAAAWSIRFGVVGHAHEASTIARRRFAEWGDRPLGPGECRRVTAYFSAVVRRRLMRSADESAALGRRLLVGASIEADLREAGWTQERAAAEARRVAGLDSVLGGAA